MDDEAVQSFKPFSSNLYHVFSADLKYGMNEKNECVKLGFPDDEVVAKLPKNTMYLGGAFSPNSLLFAYTDNSSEKSVVKIIDIEKRKELFQATICNNPRNMDPKFLDDEWLVTKSFYEIEDSEDKKSSYCVLLNIKDEFYSKIPLKDISLLHELLGANIQKQELYLQNSNHFQVLDFFGVLKRKFKIKDAHWLSFNWILAPDSTKISCQYRSMVNLFSMNKGEKIGKLEHKASVSNHAWSPDSNYLVSGTDMQEGDVYVWDATAGDLLHKHNLNAWSHLHGGLPVSKVAWHQNNLIMADGMGRWYQGDVKKIFDLIEKAKNKKQLMEKTTNEQNKN